MGVPKQLVRTSRASPVLSTAMERMKQQQPWSQEGVGSDGSWVCLALILCETREVSHCLKLKLRLTGKMIGGRMKTKKVN